MKINSIQSPNFKAVKYNLCADEYVENFLSNFDRQVLKQAEEKLKNTRFWDLKVTAKGLEVASINGGDYFLDEFVFQYPSARKSTLTVESIYDGFCNPCKNYKKCYFDLKYKTPGNAMLAFENFQKLTHVEKVVKIVEKLEEQSAELYPSELKKTIARPTKWYQRLWG